MIQLDSITKRFGSLTAVDSISLSVNNGELFSFLGPNGAGKTTTIKMMVGLMAPDSGHIFLNGIDTGQDPVGAKQIVGYIPDEPFLYNELTGIEFLTVIGNLFGMDKDLLHSQTELYGDRLEMKEWIADPIGAYSRGMKQRVVFASALIHTPRILVIDEPMVGLDPRTARIIKDLLREQVQSGVTVFLSTHNLNVAEELSHRIGIIHRGSLIWVGTLDELRQARGEADLEELFLQLVNDESALRSNEAVVQNPLSSNNQTT